MGRQLRSTITSGGQLELSLIDVETPAPGPDQVVVRVEAAPINPSDLGLLLGPADMSQAQVSGSPDHPIVTAPIPAQLLPALADRFDEPMAAGNEGAGVVVEAGSSDAAQALLGKTVALLAGRCTRSSASSASRNVWCCGRARPRSRAPHASSIL